MPAPLVEVGTSLDEVHCPFCQTLIYATTAEFSEAEVAAPACAHVFLLAHDEGIEYLSPAARAQLESSGVSLDVEASPLNLTSENDDEGRWEILDRVITLAQARVLAVYAPAPVFAGWYMGVCETPQ